MKVLVVGGAGYIGSHTARGLRDAGADVVLFDNLTAGHAEVADRLDVPLVLGDLACIDDICKALVGVDSVLHFAAYAYVGESVTDPVKYYRNNVTGAVNLLEAMRRAGVRKFVFSSTCATYGIPTTATIDESHPQAPINPYGWSKWMVEQILRDCDLAYDLRSVVLRYFNAAGASSDGLLGEDHTPETHLIPLCLQAAAGIGPSLSLFGEDYPTLDGTCVRDYIHVEDLASAHTLAVKHLLAGGDSLVCNVGVGKGYSVKEVIRCCEQVTGKKVPVRVSPRRAGDPPTLVARADKIRQLFGWRPTYTELGPIVQTAWNWMQTGGWRQPTRSSR